MALGKKYELTGIGEEEFFAAISLVAPKLSVETCLSFLHFGRESGIQKLYAKAIAWISSNLPEIVSHEHFLKFTKSQVSSVVSDSKWARVIVLPAFI